MEASTQPPVRSDAPAIAMSMEARPAASVPAGQPIGEAAEDRAPAGERIIWEGTTWDACPMPCMCLAPLCCMKTYWKITPAAIDTASGCCRSKEDTLQLRRVRDVSFQSNICVRCFCCGRGTVVIHSADETHPELRLTTQHAKGIYTELKDHVNRAAAGAAIYHAM